MKSRIIICISIFGFLTAILLSNMRELQNKEAIESGTQSYDGQAEEDAVTLFQYTPVDW